MTKGLSLQDKLALALTSAGSIRELARRVGVTHQKISRWLREDPNGTPEFDGRFRGVLHIPETAARAIDRAYENHAEFVRGQAHEAGLPFNRAAPSAMFRVPLRKTTPQGEPILGDRVIVDRSQWMHPELRNKIIQGAQDSGKYAIASVRSVIKLEDYFKDRAREELRERPRKISVKRLSGLMLKAWQERERKEHGRSIDADRPYPLYTARQFISPHMAPRGTRDAVKDINAKLRQKHEPATGDPGTVLADQLLFQLLPPHYSPQKHAAPLAAKKARNQRVADIKRQNKRKR